MILTFRKQYKVRDLGFGIWDEPPEALDIYNSSGMETGCIKVTPDIAAQSTRINCTAVICRVWCYFHYLQYLNLSNISIDQMIFFFTTFTEQIRNFRNRKT